MKKIKQLVVLLLVVFSITAPAQNLIDSLSSINGVLQPDSIRGDILSVSELNLNSASLATPLPSSVSNDTSRFFPPIFLQSGNSCLHSAEIGYTFTYEMNRLNGVAAGSWNNHDPNLYPYLYSFNYVNGGANVLGTPIYSGFRTVLSNGCPMYNDWCYSNGQNNSILYWMDGYEKYHRGMSNRVVGVKTITLYNNNSADIHFNKLKHWLADHGDGSEIGGVAVICIYTDNWVYNSVLPPASAHSGEYVVSQIGNGTVAHAMTIVGYDDNVCYDINGDGYITTNIDINGDGRINTYDSEYGALKIANSWDTWFGNNGFIWLPYSLLDEITPIGSYRKVYVCDVEERNVQLTYKATVRHSHRGHLALYIGYSSSVTSSMPQVRDTLNVFNNQGGGSVHIHGIDQNPIEIGLDFSSKYPNLNSCKKFFLQAVDNNNVGGNYSEGECFLQDFSLIDYRWGETFELPCIIPNIEIGKNTTTTLAINYDLLPFDDNPLPNVLNSNKIVRRTINIGSNIQISNDVNVDMYGTDSYDCNIVVKQGSTMTIDDGVTFTAKRGACKIIVEGNLVLGENVSFCADTNATLQLDFSCAQSVSSFNGSTFQKCDLILPSKSLRFCNCSFLETPLIMDNQKMNSGLLAIIDSCSFVSTLNQFENAIYINYYDAFMINNNTINGNESHFLNGLLIMNCGNTNTMVERFVSNNNISSCRDAGLVFYSSSGNIRNNKISGNRIGVQLLDNCNVGTFSGYCGVQSPQDTQFIHDNDTVEVRITRNCIPSQIRYNYINATASSHPYIKYEDVLSPGTTLSIDIAYNYWGEGLNPVANFVSTDPNVSFTHLPLWVVGACYGHEGNDERNLIVIADSLSSIGEYNKAKLLYRQVIKQYPSTVSAQVALKTLFNLECVAGLDFDGLKMYYLNDTVIGMNAALKSLAFSMSNKCNDAMHNYDEVIAWYESVLLDSLATFNDSIFAAIDLGDLYLRMEATGEKGLVGKLPQFIPASREAHKKRVSHALSLLPHSEKMSMDIYPVDYWLDVVTEQPEGYKIDEHGNVTISSAEGLAWFAAVVNGRNGQEANDFEGKIVKLDSDIDMGLHLWEAIGNSFIEDSVSFEYVQRFFKGSFDGGKHEISNLIHGYKGYYRRLEQFGGYDKCQGLFGNLVNARVENLRMKGFVCLNDLETGLHFGSVAAVAEESVVDRCYSKGSLFPEDHFWGDKGIPAGGIVYRSVNSEISNCVFVADSCISIQMGGIVHDNYTTNESRRAEVSNCYVFGKIIDYVDDSLRIGYSAGVAYANRADSGIENGSIIRNCYYYPVSPGNDIIGHRTAIACYNYTGCTIENCYYLAVPDINFYNGICGDNGGSVRDVSAFSCIGNSCVLETPLEIGEELTDDLEEALNLWINVQENPEDYENWCRDVWMEQGGGPLLCAVYEMLIEGTEGKTVIVPNPIESVLYIISDAIVSVDIYDVMGRKLVKTTDNQIDMSTFRPGIYIVSIVFNNGKNYQGKVIKK